MEFHCIADRCRHSCCIGWEIDIDPDTYALYRELPGPFGEYVRSHIAEDGDGTPHFVLDENERCPFLNRQNLCELILNLGEEALCDICSEHPRFYVETEDGYHMGYGLCCEEAGRLCLFGEEPIFGHTIEACAGLCELPAFQTVEALEDFVDLLLGLEHLGQEWPNLLDGLKKKLAEGCTEDLQAGHIEGCTNCGWFGDYSSRSDSEKNRYDSFFKMPLSHLYEYLNFRYDHKPYCDLIWQFLYVLCLFEDEKQGGMKQENVIELCRLYSSEIEYCEENTEAIKAYAMKHA